MASGKEACNKQDVMELVSLLHADVARVKETTATLMGIMDPHNRNKISFDTFRCEDVRNGSRSCHHYVLPWPSEADIRERTFCVCFSGLIKDSDASAD